MIIADEHDPGDRWRGVGVGLFYKGHQDTCHTFYSAHTFAPVQRSAEFQTAPQFRIFFPVRLCAGEYTHGIQHGIAGDG